VQALALNRHTQEAVIGLSGFIMSASTIPQAHDEHWFAQITEEILEPDRPIIDPHHHLWRKRFGQDYLLADLWRDTQSGHNVKKTVFMECRAFHRREGPDYLRPLGETETIASIADEAANSPGRPQIAGMVCKADLTLASESPDQLNELLDEHEQLSGGRFRGIRHAGAHDKHPGDLVIPGDAPPYLYGKEAFRQGLRVLAGRGLSYDTWHFHHQNLDFLELAQAVPECTMVLDHFGTPLGVGVYAACKDEIFQQWKQEIREIARCPNVVAKLGGLAMPDNGFGWHKQDCPPSSDDFVAAQRKYYLHAIECFGPQRCMFESNFPVDRLSIGYATLWNGFKKLVADFSDDEKHALFYGTAERVYRLQD
jgi:predicted TIM-barrel fold metal-dependent hydrolase